MAKTEADNYTAQIVIVTTGIILVVAIIVGAILVWASHGSDNARDKMIACLNAGQTAAECAVALSAGQ